MEKFEAVLVKKEEVILSHEEFKKEFSEFFSRIGRTVVREDFLRRFENENIAVSYSFKEISLKEVVDLDLDGSPEGYLQLTNFTLESGDSVYDFSKEEKQPTVLFKENPNYAIVEGFAFTGKDVVILNVPPDSPEGILVLMHELGHINDPKIRDELDRMLELKLIVDTAGRDIGETAMERDAMRLRQERSAWAYALNTLRPFRKGLNVSDEKLDAFVHQYSLGSHCNAMPKNYDY